MSWDMYWYHGRKGTLKWSESGAKVGSQVSTVAGTSVAKRSGSPPKEKPHQMLRMTVTAPAALAAPSTADDWLLKPWEIIDPLRKLITKGKQKTYAWSGQMMTVEHKGSVSCKVRECHHWSVESSSPYNAAAKAATKGKGKAVDLMSDGSVASKVAMKDLSMMLLDDREYLHLLYLCRASANATVTFRMEEIELDDQLKRDLLARATEELQEDFEEESQESEEDNEE
ncbi:hypothetical protein BKA93DRAFT_747852 [Sparassis latifolia]